jgi:hypothetical protein
VPFGIPQKYAGHCAIVFLKQLNGTVECVALRRNNKRITFFSHTKIAFSSFVLFERREAMLFC